MSASHFDELLDLCELPKTENVSLLYRASRDGFSAESFHSKCDGKQNTLTVILTVENYVFGGFTAHGWLSKGAWKEDSRAFVFSLVNREKTPIVMKCIQPKYAIFCDATYGPT